MLPDYNVTDVGSKIVLAIAINIFFRKSFSFDYIGPILFLVALATCTANYAEKASLTWGYVHYVIAKGQTMFLDWEIQDVVNLIFTFGFLYYRQNLSDAERRRWISIVLLAFVQIARNPSTLKNILRPLRVGLGPTSILNASSIGWVGAWDEPSLSLKTLLCVGCFIASASSVILFRPDNTVLLQMFLTNERLPNYRTRKDIHAMLNILSVAFAFAMCVYQRELVL